MTDEMTEKLDFTAKQKPVEYRFKWPLDSDYVLDANGNRICEVQKDHNGEPILDEFSRPVPKLDDNGEPVYLKTPQPDPSTQVEVVIRAVGITRRMRMEAIDAASLAHMKKYGEGGLIPSVFEREIVNRIIRWSNLKGIPGNGWDDLNDPTLGDHIVKMLNIWGQLSGKEAIEQGKGSSPQAVQTRVA